MGDAFPAASDLQFEGGSQDGKPKSILARTRARKSAEAEVAQLANRLQHLRNAQQTTRKSMESTRMRTREILRLKDENEEKARLKNRSSRRALNFADPAPAFDAGFWKPAATSADWKNATKDDDEVDFKKESKIAKDKVQKQIFEENKSRTQEVRKRREMMVKQRAEEEKKKMRAIQARMKRRCDDEDTGREKAELMLRRMEVEEQKLIEQVRHSQQLQHSAFAELQSTLGF